MEIGPGARARIVAARRSIRVCRILHGTERRGAPTADGSLKQGDQRLVMVQWTIGFRALRPGINKACHVVPVLGVKPMFRMLLISAGGATRRREGGAC